MAKKVQTIKVEVKEPTTFWEKTKALFNRSETILLARAEAFVGLLIGAASMVDWTPLMGVGQDITGMNWKQGATIGGIMFVKGLVSELARRRGTKELADGRLVPKAQ
jgi:hypothetical protein